ncbi:MAG: Flp family type IVb pilin [Proteobacteria bacterium]|nr:Flp family type IVb pilin [Pseudomonadota bacterium]
MLKQFLKDEQGQTTVEYLLIIAVVVVVISVLGKQMQEKIRLLTDNIFNQINTTVTGIMKGAAR